MCIGLIFWNSKRVAVILEQQGIIGYDTDEPYFLFRYLQFSPLWVFGLFEKD